MGKPLDALMYCLAHSVGETGLAKKGLSALKFYDQILFISGLPDYNVPRIRGYNEVQGGPNE